MLTTKIKTTLYTFGLFFLSNLALKGSHINVVYHAKIKIHYHLEQQKFAEQFKKKNQPTSMLHISVSPETNNTNNHSHTHPHLGTILDLSINLSEWLWSVRKPECQEKTHKCMRKNMETPNGKARRQFCHFQAVTTKKSTTLTAAQPLHSHKKYAQKKHLHVNLLSFTKCSPNF